MTQSKGVFRVAATVCVVYTAAFAAVAYEHVRYPGFTEAMEGDVLQHVERAAAGKAIYTPATAEYIPLAYFPGYYYLAAPFHWLFGDDVRGPRLTSCVCSFLAALAFGGIVNQQSRSPAAGLMTIALFFAGYRIKDENLTTALPDAALLMWLSLAWAMLIGERSRKRDLASALFFFAAFWTKQQGALLAGWGLVYMFLIAPINGRWLADRRVLALIVILYSVGLAVIFGGSFIGERAFHFTVEVPSAWDRSYISSIQRFALVSFLYVPFAWLASGVFAWRNGAQLKTLREPLSFLVATTAITCLYTVATTGSSNNHYIPLFSLLEAAAVLGVWRIAKEGPPRWLVPLTVVAALVGCLVGAAAAWKNEGHPLPLFVAPVLVVVALLGWFFERRLGWPRAWAVLLLIGQFAASFYLPWDYFPPRGWQQTLQDFREELRRLENDVAWPDYGAIPTALTGQAIIRFPSWVVLEDVSRTSHPDPSDLQPFRDRMKTHPSQWLITGTLLESIPIWQDFAKAYRLETDYGARFAGLPQLSRHWYGDRVFPRYIYRHVANR